MKNGPVQIWSHIAQLLFPQTHFYLPPLVALPISGQGYKALAFRDYAHHLLTCH